MLLKDKNLYYVGGYVRDEKLGVTNLDVDFCYEGNALDFALKNNLNIIKENPDFGTVKVLINNKEIDIASTRCESYPKTAHLPVVSNIGCSLKEDLRRRDFTINALAKNTFDNQISDYFNGLDDIKNRKLRVLHEKSFIEDPSRIIRGLKFSIRLNFELDQETQRLQDEYLNNINYDQSYHRLKKELKETFNLNSEIAFEKFISQGIYKLLSNNIKQLSYNENIEQIIAKYQPKHIWLVYLGALDLNNFDLTAEENLIVSTFNNIKNQQPKDDFESYKMFNKIPLEAVLLYCKFVDKNIALNYLENLKDVRIDINGVDLLDLGFKQGEIFKEIFDYVLEYKIKNPSMTKSEEIDLIKGKYKCC